MFNLIFSIAVHPILLTKVIEVTIYLLRVLPFRVLTSGDIYIMESSRTSGADSPRDEIGLRHMPTVN